MKKKIILASASSSRANILKSSGIFIEQEPADVDEDTVKTSFRNQNGSAAQVAEMLAERKALDVSRRHGGALVIGADQMLDCDGVWFDKPADLVQVRNHLTALRGRTHELLSAVCVVRDGACLWRHLESAHLTMRPFSDVFLEEYIENVGEKACLSVGAYQLEGRGAQLFSRIEGDYFTILGLPLLPLLEFFVTQGVVTP
jgi:septum formation protein